MSHPTQQSITKRNPPRRTKSYIINNQYVHKSSPSASSISSTSTSSSISTHIHVPTMSPREDTRSAPPHYKKKKRRTFKLAEPMQSEIAQIDRKKNTHEKQMVDIKTQSDKNKKTLQQPQKTRSRSFSPTAYTTKKKRNSFKLGDDRPLLTASLFCASSFESYHKKFNVHKPKIHKGSNHFLISQQMIALQQKLKMEQKEKELEMHQFDSSMTINQIDQYLNVLHKDCLLMKDLQINAVKLPNYEDEIPLILIELTKRLHACDGLKHRKIFHISVKNNTDVHHHLAKLIVSVFNNLSPKLLENVSILNFQRIVSLKQIPDIMNIIPNPNKSILFWLFDLMADTIEHAMDNKMNIESLSKSVAPYMIHRNKRKIHSKMIINFFKCAIEWRLYLREHH